MEGDEQLGEFAAEGLPGISQKLRATCWVSVEAPCALRISRTSTNIAFTMRIGSNPECWKKRLSSTEMTAFDQNRRDVVRT